MTLKMPMWPKCVTDDLYGSESEEVVLKTTPVMAQDTITRSDLQDIIDGWEEKFDKLAEGVCAIEEGTHVHKRKSCARECPVSDEQATQEHPGSPRALYGDV